MARTSTNDDALMRDLCSALARMQNADVLGRFLYSVCSERELRQLLRRWRIAILLHMGFSYRIVQEKTGAGTATVARIARILHMPASVLQAMCGERMCRVQEEVQLPANLAAMSALHADDI